MQTNRQNPTVEQFKQFAADVAPAARAVLLARIHAETERQRVDAYILPIFRRYGFRYCGELADKCGGDNQPVSKHGNLYLCEDPRIPEYFEECDAAHRAHGFTGPHGNCPALTAEHLVVETENALIDLATPLFGVESHQLIGDKRAKYLDLIIGAAVKASAERSGR